MKDDRVGNIARKCRLFLSWLKAAYFIYAGIPSDVPESFP